MSTFMIDTDSVNAVKSAIDSVVSQMESIGSGVGSYDTSCQDGFDFASARNAIVNNIEACGIKMKNTATVIDKVVSSHTRLQQSLVFGTTNEQNVSSSNGSRGNGGYYSSGGYSGYSGYSSGGYSSDGGFSSFTATALANAGLDENLNPITDYSSYTKQDSDYDDSKDTYTPDYDDVVKDVTTSISSIGSGIADVENLETEAKSFFEDSNIEYNEAGYAVMGGLLVIACDSSIGNIGDLVKINLSDGRVIDCIVGDNSLEEGELRFYVNETWSEENTNNITFGADEISSITNYGAEGVDVYLDTVDVPKVGEHTSDIELLDDEWTVVSTKVSVEDYLDVVKENKITQDSDVSKYGGSCLSVSYTHASNLYNGKTDDVVDDGNYKYAEEFNSFYSDDKDETLKVIYSQILRGKPVIMQVNGNEDGSNRHFVTVVGFRKSVSDPSQLTEKDLLIIDPWDGNVERMDQDGSRFMTTGKQCGEEYTGYYLRCLKTIEEEEKEETDG